jgi:DNA-binding response OmpR family regulator
MISMVSCPETRARLYEVAQAMGISVVTANNPTVVRATADAMTPNLLVVEIAPTWDDALPLIEELRERHPSSAIVALGSDPGERTALDALKAGAVEYVHIPAAREELQRVLVRAQQAIPTLVEELPTVERMDGTIVCVPDPVLVESTVVWVIQHTSMGLPPNRRLHLRAALQELVLNAVEHGSLEIYYQEKQAALAQGTYDALVAARRRDPRLAARRVTVRWVYDKRERILRYSVVDEGRGFRWKSLLGRSRQPCPTDEANGRGLFLVQGLFPNLAYNERGNEVTLTVPLP